MFGKGYVHLYTGNGKGKTTAALGLALRAAGAGLRTIVVQFMKGQHYSELDSVKKLGGMITIEQYGSARFCRPDDENFGEHLDFARRGLARSREVLSGNGYDIVVLDEIVTAQMFGLVSADDIAGLIRGKPEGVELIITGRGATEPVIALCDLVTEMKEVKHYYQAGVQARKGIES